MKYLISENVMDCGRDDERKIKMVRQKFWKQLRFFGGAIEGVKGRIPLLIKIVEILRFQGMYSKKLFQKILNLYLLLIGFAALLRLL